MPYGLAPGRIPSGVEGLDEILGEGYLPGSSTICAGPTGAGKTILGLHFIFEGARHGERGLIATLQENRSQLERLAANFGWSLADDNVDVLYHSPVDVYVDEWVYELLEAVEPSASDFLYRADLALGENSGRPTALTVVLSGLTQGTAELRGPGGVEVARLTPSGPDAINVS